MGRESEVLEMSRSVKRVGVEKGGSYGVAGKRWSNRRVRRASEVGSGASYKRVSDSWNIWDWKVRAEDVEDEAKRARMFRK